jgi:hypothetical protein
VNDLIRRYQPRWLYLHEFADALRRIESKVTDDDIAEAITLLVRDRLVEDGRLNEREFRFLEGKPDVRTTAWLSSIAAEDFNWSDSQILAGVDTTKMNSRVSDQHGVLIEIAESCIDYFEHAELRAIKQRTNSGPEVRRAKAVLQKLYPKGVPSSDRLTDGDLHSSVNKALGKDERSISKTTVLRAAGRRTDKRSK